MNFNLLIDNIVRQTTVLVAQLATAAGGRAPLAHIAGQVFVELVRELKAQGLSNKVIADMFGLTLRTYHDRVRRASESATERGTSLWEAVLRYVRGRQVITRAELLRRFHADDESTVRGVLNDLVGNGLLFKSGRADSTTYRAASEAEIGAISAVDPQRSAAGLVWVTLHQRGSLTRHELEQTLGLPLGALDDALNMLQQEGKVVFDPAASRYRTEQCVIAYGDEFGWEAALFDHFQAVLTAIGSKLTRGSSLARKDEATGGSTYHFDLYRGHPLEGAVLALLTRTRESASALRAEVEEHPVPPQADRYRVVFYVGRGVRGGPGTDQKQRLHCVQRREAKLAERN